MRITPKSEAEVAMDGLLDKGIYPFEIKKATERVSKSGNPMIELILCVWDVNGNEHIIYDYLMESIGYKLRHCYYAACAGAIYESGNLNADDLVGKQGLCKIIIREDKTGQYPPKNTVVDYVTNKSASEIIGMTNHVIKSNQDNLEQDIPF